MSAAIDTTGVGLMSEDRARECVDGIKRHVEGVRELVFELYEGDGWRSLGYRSWRACVTAEFPKSQAALYRELKTAKVEANLSHVRKGPEINPRQAAELAKLKEPEQQREAWQEAVDTAPEGKVTAKHVAEVVAKRVPQPELKPRPRPEPEPEPEPAAEHPPEDDGGFEPPANVETDAPVSWECPECGSTFDGHRADSDGWVSRGFCGHCEEADEEDASGEFDPRGATYRLEMAFMDVFESWPRTTPLDELVEWLSIKHAMMKAEAERWNK